MTITRGNHTKTEQASGSSLAATKPTGLSDGDVLIAVIGVATSNTITKPSGWVDGVSNTNSTDSIWIQYKVITNAASEPSSYTWSNLSGRTAIYLTIYSGVDNTTPIDVAGSTGTNTGSGSSVTISSLTTVTDGCMLITAMCGNATNNLTFTVPSGFNAVIDQNSNSQGKGSAYTDLLQSTKGATGTMTWTWSQSNLDMRGATLPLRPGSTGVSGSAALSAQSALTAAASLDVFGVSTELQDFSAVTSALLKVPGVSTLLQDFSLTSVPSLKVLGGSALSSETSLSAFPSLNVLATAPLTSESDLTVSPVVFTSGASAQVQDFSLTVSPVVVTSSSASLSAQSDLTAVGSTYIPGSSTLSAQTDLTAVPSITVLAGSALTSESALTVGALLNIPGVSSGIQDFTLTSVGSVSGSNTANLSSQSSLSAVGMVTTSGASGMVQDFSLTAVSAGSVSGSASLIQGFSLVAVGAPTVTGSVGMLLGSSLTADPSGVHVYAAFTAEQTWTLTPGGYLLIQSAPVGLAQNFGMVAFTTTPEFSFGLLTRTARTGELYYVSRVEEVVYVVVAGELYRLTRALPMEVLAP